MSGIVGSKLNIRGSGLVGSLGTDGQHLLSSGAGKKHVFETVAAAESYDDEPIKSDLTALAIREATNEASAAFNLPGSFIETFTDDTNLGTQTTVDRDSGYVSTNVPINAFTTASTLTTNLLSVYNFDGDATDAVGSVPLVAQGTPTFSTSIKKLGTHSVYLGSDADGYSFNYNSTNEPIWTTEDAPISMSAWVYRSADTNTWNMLLDAYNGTDWIFCGADASDRPAILAKSGDSWSYATGTLSQTTWYHLVFTMTTTSKQIWINGVKDVDTSGSYGIDVSGLANHRLFHRVGDSLGWRGYADQVCFWQKELSDAEIGVLYNSGSGNVYPGKAVGAAGTLIQSANSVTGTRTEVGGTMLYADNEGTATLGTDLSIFFSCDGGSNWTEAAGYNAITPVYSSGVKQVRLDKTTCTGGTDVRYKAVWANQSGGSLETRLHAIGLNY